MLFLKKFFTEGLIQVAILLSLSGVRVDVGLEPYLPSPWHQMILGPTSALTQTQFHNLRNRMEHPKSVDLDGFFATRRLLSLVRSLDRLQVPNSELEMWLVQREPDSLTGGHLDLSPPLERAPNGLERDRAGPGLEPASDEGEDTGEDIAENGELPECLCPLRPSDQSPIAIGNPHPVPYDLPLSGAFLDEEGEEDRVDEEEGDRRRRNRRRDLPGCNRRLSSQDLINNREQGQNQADQECLWLLEETFPVTHEPQLCDEVLGVSGGDDDPESLTPGSEPPLSPLIPTDRPSLARELQWQDLLAIMEPQEMGVDSTLGTLIGNRENDDALSFTQYRTLPTSDSEVLGRGNLDSDNSPVILQDVSLTEAVLLQGSVNHLNQEQEPEMLPLTPSAQLYDHNLDVHTLHSLGANPSHSPSYHMNLLAEDSSDNFSMGLDKENSTFNMNLLTPDPADNSNVSSCPRYVPSSGNPTSFGNNFHARDPFGSTPSPTLNLANPSSLLLVDDEEAEDGFPNPLGDLLEDAAILDEISLLDLALEEGFSPDMAARLEEEGYFDPQRESNIVDIEERDGSIMATREEQGHTRTHQQDYEEEADSDSGLSLDFSYSPASSCTSEASSYSSSSSSSTSADNGESDMELEVTIKQEEQGEEMGAVGGSYSSDLKKFYSGSYQEPELFSRLPWLEHIGHDHTYNQPWSSPSTPAQGKTATKLPKSSPRHHTIKPYHRHSPDHFSDTKMWNRDDRRARAMKIPFSNDLIVNLPVEEFTELLAHHRLTEEQLNLIKDIRRRGKNKMAAQNCRRRKMDAILGLGDDVTGLRRHRARLLREKQEALRSLKEMKRQLGRLYHEVFSSLRDDEGRPLDTSQYALQFGTNGSITVTSRRAGAETPWTDGNKTSRKHKDKKK